MHKHLSKYLGIIIDEHLTFEDFMTQLRGRLNRMCKVKAPVSSSFFKIIYFEIFDSHMRYAAQVWGHVNSNIVDIINKIKFSK